MNNDEYGNDFITISDDNGNEFELEVLDTLEHNGFTYMALLSTEETLDEDDGLIILRATVEDGDEYFVTPDTDEELNAVYEMFMDRIFDEEDETEN